MYNCFGEDFASWIGLQGRGVCRSPFVSSAGEGLTSQVGKCQSLVVEALRVWMVESMEGDFRPLLALPVDEVEMPRSSSVLLMVLLLISL